MDQPIFDLLDHGASGLDVRDKTEHSRLWGVYWGGFKYGSENEHITDEVIANRDSFARTYKIAQPIQNIRFCSPFDYCMFDHMELYRMKTSPDGIIMVVSPYMNPTNEEKLVGLGFKLSDPIYSIKAQSFVQIFSRREDFERFALTHDPKRDKKSTSRSASDSRLHEAFRGTIIYATPGSGKSYFCKNNDGVFDTDDLLLDEISKQYPDFPIDYDVHAGRNIYRCCGEFSLIPIYEAVRVKIQDLKAGGSTILTGSIRLMNMADFVFIQSNRNIDCREGFDHSKEQEAALNLGKYIPIFTYLDDALRHDPESP